MRIETVKGIIACLLICFVQVLSAQCDGNRYIIDFETHADGTPFQNGEVISNQYSDFGITFSSGDPNFPLVIFDSSFPDFGVGLPGSPADGDCDLGTPGFNCAANMEIDTLNNCTGSFPGMGAGGQNNCVSQGFVLIIDEHNIDNYINSTITGSPATTQANATGTIGSDGLIDSPDDKANGGSIVIDLANPFDLTEIGFVDDAEGTFIVTQENGNITTLPFNGGGNNDTLVVDLDFEDVVKVEFIFDASGAISYLDFCDLVTGQIGDQVYIDENGDGMFDAGDTPISDVTVTLDPGTPNDPSDDVTTETDSDGNYLFDNLPDGNYTVTVDTGDPDFPDYVDPSVDPDGGNDNTSDVTISGGNQDLDQDFGYTYGSIGDQLYVDNDGSGTFNAGDTPIGGVTVTLIDGIGNIIMTETAADGTYLFDSLPAGMYDVVVDINDPDFPADVANTVDPDGMNDSTSNLNLGVGEDNLDQDFGYEPLGSIGDTVWYDANGDGDQDAGEAGLEGATVTLTPPADVDLGNGAGVAITTTTDMDGMYLFDDLPEGEYDVTVDPSTITDGLPAGVTVGDLEQTFDADGTGTGNTSTYDLGAGEDNEDQDFGYTDLGSIGNQLFIDNDGDGFYNPFTGDSPLTDVDVILTPPMDVDLGNGPDQPITTSTDPVTGVYLFDDLPYGDYTVTVDTSDPDFPDVVNTVDPDGGVDNTSDVTIDATNTDDLDQDFGYEPAGSIGNQLFIDEDDDGMFGPGDTPITDVTVTITPPMDVDLGAGLGQPIATETGADGTYLFDDLPEGEYTVTVDTNDPEFPEGMSNSVDFDGGNDSESTITIGSGEDTSVLDFGYVPTVLPVEYLYYRGEATDEGGLLEWATSVEINSELFEVQKSSNGVDFEVIGIVEAAGDTRATTAYSFLDESLQGGAYYRLNQIDRDGRSELTSAIYLEKVATFSMEVYPNPFVNNLSVKVDGNDDAHVTIIEIGTGRILSQITVARGTNNLDVSQLPKGMYLVQIASENGRILLTKKMTKVN